MIVDVLEFLGGFLSALVGGVKEAVAQTLHHEGDLVRCECTGLTRAALSAMVSSVLSCFFMLVSWNC